MRAVDDQDNRKLHRQLPKCLVGDDERQCRRDRNQNIVRARLAVDGHGGSDGRGCLCNRCCVDCCFTQWYLDRYAARIQRVRRDGSKCLIERSASQGRRKNRLGCHAPRKSGDCRRCGFWVEHEVKWTGWHRVAVEGNGDGQLERNRIVTAATPNSRKCAGPVGISFLVPVTDQRTAQYRTERALQVHRSVAGQVVLVSNCGGDQQRCRHTWSQKSHFSGLLSHIIPQCGTNGAQIQARFCQRLDRRHGDRQYCYFRPFEGRTKVKEFQHACTNDDSGQHFHWPSRGL